MIDINSIAETIYLKTNEQGETVGRIVENVENAKEEVRKGNDELVEAVEKSSNLWVWIAVITAVLFIILLVWWIF
jgi:t-SNARE complex subunit (syntaxin)